MRNNQKVAEEINVPINLWFNWIGKMVRSTNVMGLVLRKLEPMLRKALVTRSQTASGLQIYLKCARKLRVSS